MVKGVRTRLAMVLFATFAVFAVATGPAWGGTSYQEFPGGDYGYVDDNNTDAVICDRETDSNGAYSRGLSIAMNRFRVEDADGSSGSCWFENIPSGVRRHITCEDINNWPDDCSDEGFSNH